MTGALAQLTEAVAVLADEGTVVELAVPALHEACPRGAAFGITSRGPRSDRVGTFRIMQGGAFLDLALPHLTYVRTSAIDVTNVPLVQRNRWVKHLGVLDGGRICVCAGQRQVAHVGVGIPEGTRFSASERARLAATSAALVVPLRIASLLAEVQRRRAPLDDLLEGTTDAIVATDRRGVILGSSKLAFDRLRQGSRSLRAYHYRRAGLPENCRGGPRRRARAAPVPLRRAGRRMADRGRRRNVGRAAGAAHRAPT